jgi:hypothetical protein
MNMQQEALGRIYDALYCLSLYGEAMKNCKLIILRFNATLC